jgi:hypothetical protein
MDAAPTSSSSEREESESSLEARRRASASFRDPATTFSLYARIDMSQIFKLAIRIQIKTFMNSSLERAHRNFLNGSQIAILKRIGNDSAKIYKSATELEERHFPEEPLQRVEPH